MPSNTQPSAGAMRAAEELSMWLDGQGYAVGLAEEIKAMAEIIDRETGAKELAKYLETYIQNHCPNGEVLCCTCTDARTALARVKGNT